MQRNQSVRYVETSGYKKESVLTLQTCMCAQQNICCLQISLKTFFLGISGKYDSPFKQGRGPFLAARISRILILKLIV